MVLILCGVTSGIISLAASGIAVAGTLLGAVVTLVFGQRATDRRQRREERLEAYSSFAGAVVEYRNGQYNRYRQMDTAWESVAGLIRAGASAKEMDLEIEYSDDRQIREYRTARNESYRLRSLALQTLYRVRLVADRSDIADLADRAMQCTSNIHKANSDDELNRRGEQARQAVEDFIDAARIGVK